MTFPTFGRLAHLYNHRMARLFSGRLWELIENPDLIKDPVFQQAAQRIAGKMVEEVAHANATSWRAAAMKSTRARKIYNALRAEIEVGGFAPELLQIAGRNAELISSVPADIAKRISARAAELHQVGARPAAIAREIRAWAPRLAKSRIQLIARTEISGAETDLTRARSERIGIDWYQWQTSEDQRVRPSHRNMDGVLVAWNDPPAPEALIQEKSTLGHYHCGKCPNCRCAALPLADISEVRWPAKVHRMGRIVRMTRTEFTRLVGMPAAA